MRRLTFKGFLDEYVQALAGEETRSLTRLAALSQVEPRLMEPLLLLAVVSERQERLSPLLSDQPRLQSELAELSRLHAKGQLERALESGDKRLRAEYVKAWRSYVTRRDAHARDADLKLVARERVLSLEKRKHVTRYRMAKDLGLNPGNLHAFLAQGNPTKVSLERALQLVRYLEAA